MVIDILQVAGLKFSGFFVVQIKNKKKNSFVLLVISKLSFNLVILKQYHIN